MMDGSSDVFSSDLDARLVEFVGQEDRRVVGNQVVDACFVGIERPAVVLRVPCEAKVVSLRFLRPQVGLAEERVIQVVEGRRLEAGGVVRGEAEAAGEGQAPADAAGGVAAEMLVVVRSEEHTSELKSLMRSSYAVFCLKNE